MCNGCNQPKDRKKHEEISAELDRQLRDNCFYYTTRPSWLLNPCASMCMIVALVVILNVLGAMIYLELDSRWMYRSGLQGFIYFLIQLSIMAGFVTFFHIRMVRELSASSVKAYYISACALQVISFIVILSIGCSYSWKDYNDTWWLYTLIIPLILVLGAIQEWSRYSVLMKLLEDYDAEEGAFARKPDQTVMVVHQPMAGHTDHEPAHMGLPISQQPVLQQPQRATCEFHESEPQAGRQPHETQADTSLAQHHSHPSQ